MPAPRPWSIPSAPRAAQRIDDDDDQWSMPSAQRLPQRIDDNFIEDDQSYSTSLSSDTYKYDTLPPLPAQRNLTPPPTLYPQQPVSVSENYSFPRFSLSGSSEINAAMRTKRSDINV
ncbi:hypothetical protein PIB30_055591 [Stylosanthes scabra]|nr:hypothetical protein [Stylosanthes scabra]